ncbi:putative variant ionotropic glutamate receptor-like 30 [Homarus americanus]|uniref:Putative variant ionotropic glutamate receptor-like 30 n=1 Tax=Homarus americanus TaxID=6706 RepID=A0A8J5MLA6_HOMAM|nr:putative variant ionotropic glutamate receptor-like 30 [Homarus americanus]
MELTVVVVSYDPAFLAAFAEWFLRAASSVVDEALVVTRLPLKGLNFLHATLSVTNSMLIIVEKPQNHQVVVYPTALQPPRWPTVESCSLDAPPRPLTSHLPLFPDKFSRLHTGPNFVAEEFEPHIALVKSQMEATCSIVHRTNGQLAGDTSQQDSGGSWEVEVCRDESLGLPYCPWHRWWVGILTAMLVVPAVVFFLWSITGLRNNDDTVSSSDMFFVTFKVLQQGCGILACSEKIADWNLKDALSIGRSTEFPSSIDIRQEWRPRLDSRGSLRESSWLKISRTGAKNITYFLLDTNFNAPLNIKAVTRQDCTPVDLENYMPNATFCAHPPTKITVNTSLTPQPLDVRSDPRRTRRQQPYIGARAPKMLDYFLPSECTITRRREMIFTLVSSITWQEKI